MRSPVQSRRAALVTGLVALGVAVASIVLMVLIGPSTGRILVLVAMVMVLLSQGMAATRYRSRR